MRGDVVGDIPVVDPQAAQARLAAEDDRPHVGDGTSLVVLVTDCQVELLARLRPPGLAAEVVGEVLGILPCVAVDVDDHGVAALTRHCQNSETSGVPGMIRSGRPIGSEIEVSSGRPMA